MSHSAKMFYKEATLLRDALGSSLFKKAVVHPLPVAVSLDISHHCNLKCSQCIRREGEGVREGGFMPVSLIQNVMSQIGKDLKQVYLYYLGEPLMHPELSSCLLASRGPERILSTNGSLLLKKAELLLEEPPEKLIVAVDTLRESNTMRPGQDVREVLEGIACLAALRKKAGLAYPKMIVQTLVFRENEPELKAIRKAVLKAGADTHQCKSVQLRDFSEAETWLPRSFRLRRYERNRNGHYQRKALPATPCMRLWRHPVVRWDGKVLPCCFDKKGEYVLGDLNRHSFRDIWYGERYHVFRQQYVQGRSKPEICHNCTTGLYPWIKR